MSEHPLPATGGTAPPPAHARLGLVAIFGATFFELVGYFMLTPLLLLRLKDGGESTALAGVFAASGWFGIFLMVPFASAVTRALGRRPTLWLSALVPTLATMGFALSSWLPLWFGLKLIAGMASGLRWVLAEALVAEFAPPAQRGRYVGLFETLVGATFVIGPLLLAWVGPQSDAAIWLAFGCMVIGLGWSLLIPRVPPAADAHEARVGLGGVWHALAAHPLIMTVGFVGGFFESGLTSILPLYGLALGLGAVVAALLVSASGLGSAIMMLPAGVLADRMAHHPHQRWGDARDARLTQIPNTSAPCAAVRAPSGGRAVLMRGCAWVTLLGTLLIPFVAGTPWLAAPVAFVWGGAGGCLYTLAMIDIGSREQGITLVNSTAVLVMSYTLGGVLAPALGAAALQWSPALGFPALLVGVAALGVRLLRKPAP